MKINQQIANASLLSHGRTMLKDAYGVAILEFALLLPVFLLLLFAVIEFGWYFVRAESVARALNETGVSIITNSGNFAQTDADGTGSGIMTFGSGSNYLCALSYATLAEAQSAAACTSSQWTTTAPSGVTPYYVAVTAHAGPASLTGFVNTIMPKGTSITQTTIVKVGSAGGPPPGGATFPACPNGYLTSNGSSLSCVVPPTCAAGETLTFSGGAFTCTAAASGAPIGGCAVYLVQTHGAPSQGQAWGDAVLTQSGHNCQCPTTDATITTFTNPMASAGEYSSYSLCFKP